MYKDKNWEEIGLFEACNYSKCAQYLIHEFLHEAVSTENISPFKDC